MEAQVDVAAQAPLILTLKMDGASQARFERLRVEHYPAELNRIAAHLTLFHKLPQSVEVSSAVALAAAAVEGFAMKVTGLRSLGRGVAFGLESSELIALHSRLAGEFTEYLSAQDRQRFWPHVVVQNKTTGERARQLKERLEAEFRPFAVQAMGLQLWRYLGGPWELAEEFLFWPPVLTEGERAAS